MPINDFIKEFGLRNPDGVVAFNAIIEFLVSMRNERKRSEVHILKILGKDTIYLLNPGIDPHELPDFFDDQACTFTYIPASCLKIEGRMKGLEYRVSIFPL